MNMFLIFCSKIFAEKTNKQNNPLKANYTNEDLAHFFIT